MAAFGGTAYSRMLTPTDLSPMTGIFPPRYLAPISYYAAMAACDRVIINTGLRYDKRCKAVHRADIADTHGLLRLTVPVSKDPDAIPGTRPLWSDRTVSAHGRWWEIHRVALESAYGRTPYFQFYIDNLLPLISEASIGCSVIDLDTGLDIRIRAMLHLDTEVICGEASDDAVYFEDMEIPDAEPYWQVRADRHGFMPGLSIVDLLFNMGPEAQLILRRMSRQITIRQHIK